MNQRNAYQYTADGPSTTGTEWPRVSARVGLEGRRAAVPSRGAASRDARRRPRQPPANAYSMPLPPQGPPEPADDGGSWSSFAGDDDGDGGGTDARRAVQDRSNSIEAIADARRDTNQRMQAQFQRWSGENDFTPYNSAVPPQPANGAQSTRLVRSSADEQADAQDTNPAKNYDPSVPSYAQPGFDPLQPSASADIGVILDQIRGKPERGEIALRRASEPVATELQAYPQVFPDAPFLQLPQSNLILNPVPVYISLDSRDRDRRAWPQTNRYRIPFVSSSESTSVRVTGDRLRNIYSISVLSCVVPNTTGIMNLPYLLLQFDEIDGTYDSPNLASEKAFTKLYFREVGTSNFLRLDKAVGDPSTRIYWPAPRATLDHLTVSFRNYDGTLFDFGADSAPPTDPILELQTTLTLEIRTYVTDTAKAIGHRNA